MVSHGPCQPWRIEMAAAPALAIIIGTRNGETRRGPLVVERQDLLLEGVEAADAGAEDHAARAAGRRRARRPGRAPSGPRPARTGRSGRCGAPPSRCRTSGAGSKSSMARLASPGSTSSPSQKASTPMPQRASTPSPVTATRRPLHQSLEVTRSSAWPTVSTPSSSSSSTADVELLLERHDQLDQVEAVGVEVVGEAWPRGSTLLGVDGQHLDRALLEPLEIGVVAHGVALRCVGRGVGAGWRIWRARVRPVRR